MNQDTKNILNIVKSALTNQKSEIREPLNLDKIFETGIKHKILTIIYYGFKNCNITLDSQNEALLRNIVLNESILSEQQLHNVYMIEKQFNNNNIDYLLLKGSEMKHLYPRSELRRMGDIDILIREEQYERISGVMSSLGFVFKNESNHEIVWIKQNIVVELHKIMVPTYNKDFHKYFGNGWNKALKYENNKYIFSPEDMFIHIFCHFAKHFRDSGIGIMHMCDIYILMQNKNINTHYVYNELKKLKIYDFFCNIQNTLEVWFNNKESSEMTDYITSVIFESGIYGLHEKNIVSNALKEKRITKNIYIGKIHRIFLKTFPPYKSMRRKYQILKKIPALLPAFWIFRLIEALFFKHKDISDNFNEISTVTHTQIDEYEKALKYVGLDYNF